MFAMRMFLFAFFCIRYGSHFKREKERICKKGIKNLSYEVVQKWISACKRDVKDQRGRIRIREKKRKSLSFCTFILTCINPPRSTARFLLNGFGGETGGNNLFLFLSYFKNGPM
jgi:hypothetical protein